MFDSAQLKSATDNIGTFDSTNPDIRYSKKSDLDIRLANALELQNALAEKLMDYADTITQSTNIEALQKHASYLETRNNALRDTKKGLRETIGEQSREIKRLEKKNKALAESRDRWKNETKRTGKRITDPKAIEKAAKRLLKTYNVDTEHYGLEELTNKLQSLYDGMTFGVDERGEYYSYDSAMEAARDIAEDIAKWATGSSLWIIFCNGRSVLQSAKIFSVFLLQSKKHSDILCLKKRKDDAAC